MRFVHVNLVAHDWRRLAAFYEQVFGCTPVGPERSLAEPWLAQATGVPHAALAGCHLRLPGAGADGPTLEIFEYAEPTDRPRPTVANRPGFGHIAFAVDDVEAARRRVVAAGGRDVGQPVTALVPGAGQLCFVYVADPEDNIIELQRWRRETDG
jgi:predicted enzyme related to lactoylglutathione lyase